MTHGFGTQGAVSQYLLGTIPLNLDAAVRFARALKCGIEEFSPTLAAKVSHISEPESYYGLRRGPEFRGSVPVISWTTAGNWAEVQDHFAPGDAEDWFPITTKVGPHAFALKVVGDSMEPKIPDGAIVVIDPGRPYQHGSYVLAKRTGDQGATLKQLWYDGAVPKLKPLNPRYSILDMSEDTRIIGVVVYWGVEP